MYKHLAVIVAACFSTIAMAGDGPGAAKAAVDSPPMAAKTGVGSTFESLDKNGDARISRTEAGMDKGLLNIFATADTDGDGYVSKDEYVARPKG